MSHLSTSSHVSRLFLFLDVVTLLLAAPSEKCDWWLIIAKRSSSSSSRSEKEKGKRKRNGNLISLRYPPLVLMLVWCSCWLFLASRRRTSLHLTSLHSTALDCLKWYDVLVSFLNDTVYRFPFQMGNDTQYEAVQTILSSLTSTFAAYSI